MNFFYSHSCTFWCCIHADCLFAGGRSFANNESVNIIAEDTTSKVSLYRTALYRTALHRQSCTTLYRTVCLSCTPPSVLHCLSCTAPSVLHCTALSVCLVLHRQSCTVPYCTVCVSVLYCTVSPALYSTALSVSPALHHQYCTALSVCPVLYRLVLQHRSCTVPPCLSVCPVLHCHVLYRTVMSCAALSCTVLHCTICLSVYPPDRPSFRPSYVHAAYVFCRIRFRIGYVKEQCRLDMRKYSFSHRVINEWNKLPNDCVNASSVNMFKIELTDI